MPAGRAITKDSTSAARPNSNVTGKRSTIISDTARCCSIDVPKSPFIKFNKNLKYCTTSGWSRPSLFLMF
jgi:hypothetical protein